MKRAMGLGFDFGVRGGLGSFTICASLAVLGCRGSSPEGAGYLPETSLAPAGLPMDHIMPSARAKMMPSNSARIVAPMPGPAGAVLINNGATLTSSTQVTVGVAPQTGIATQVCLSDTGTCSNWLPYSPSKNWTLPPGDGPKRVYVWWRDGAGQSRPTPAIARIRLDATPPIGGRLTPVQRGQTVTWNWSGFVDMGSGIASYTLVTAQSNTLSDCNSGTKVYTGTNRSFTQGDLAPGIYYALVCATDAVGNTSAGVSGVVTIPSVQGRALAFSSPRPRVYSSLRPATSPALPSGATRVSPVGATQSSQLRSSAVFARSPYVLTGNTSRHY